MSSPHDYNPNPRQSPQPSSGSQQGLVELPALDVTNVSQGIAHTTFDAAYRSPNSTNETANYSLARMSDPGHHTGAPQYQQGHSSYHQHTQGAIMNYIPARTSDPGHHTGAPQDQQGQSDYHQHAQSAIIPYLPGQTQPRDIYPQPGGHQQWGQGHHHHHHGTDINRSASWSPPHVNYSAPQLVASGSTSMIQAQHPINNRGRKEIVLPQRPYVPHHRQNYFDQFNPEGPITFPKTTGGDGIVLMDAMNENFDSLIGRDDPMFASYVGPAISLRLEWPGYKSWTKQIKTKEWTRDPKPITKAKLAFEVARKVRDFMQENINEPMTPGTERWKVGPGFIEVKDLVLVRMVHVSKGSWQAEFRVLDN